MFHKFVASGGIMWKSRGILRSLDFPPPASDPANGNLQKLQDRLAPKVVLPALSRLRRLRRAQVAGFRLCWKPWLSAALEGKMQKCGDAPTSMTSMKFRKTSEFQN